MEFSTLLALYPVARELIERVPQLKEWLEKKVKKDDPVLFMYLEMQQSRTELRDSLLENSILTALLANPHLTKEEIEERFIKSREATKEIVKSIREM